MELWEKLNMGSTEHEGSNFIKLIDQKSGLTHSRIPSAET